MAVLSGYTDGIHKYDHALPMKRIVLLAGGSGMIGQRLSALLQNLGYEIRVLSRSPKGPNQFRWDPAKGEIDTRSLEGVHAVINLAGEGIASGRWTKARKRRIFESRVQSSLTLKNAAASLDSPPEVYISSSAIGYYGNTGEKKMVETDSPVEETFMVKVCREWEEGAYEMEKIGIRTVILRIGIVLAPEGGALKPLALPTSFGLAPYFGDGNAWWSWIHVQDLCRMFLFAIENSNVRGVFNAVGPNPVRNKTLIKAIARARGKWTIPAPAPAFALRLALGEMSATILNSNLVSADKIQKVGFSFDFREIDSALADLYTR